MPSKEIAEFAKMLVHHVRDAAIQSSDRELLSEAGSPVAKRWKDAIHGGQPSDVAKTIIPDVVDDTIVYLLQAIDQGILQLSFTGANGKTVNLSKDGLGELSGWYMGSEGWRQLHSKERFVDDFSDLK